MKLEKEILDEIFKLETQLHYTIDSEERRAMAMYEFVRGIKKIYEIRKKTQELEEQ
jgi:hypothetical protein